jgi:hypothetical protein
LWEPLQRRCFPVLDGERASLRTQLPQSSIAALKIFFANAKKLLHSKKHGRKVRTLRHAGDFFETHEPMSRMHIAPLNSLPTSRKRGTEAFGQCTAHPRADRRASDTPID